MSEGFSKVMIVAALEAVRAGNPLPREITQEDLESFFMAERGYVERVDTEKWPAGGVQLTKKGQKYLYKARHETRKRALASIAREPAVEISDLVNTNEPDRPGDVVLAEQVDERVVPPYPTVPGVPKSRRWRYPSRRNLRRYFGLNV